MLSSTDLTSAIVRSPLVVSPESPLVDAIAQMNSARVCPTVFRSASTTPSNKQGASGASFFDAPASGTPASGKSSFGTSASGATVSDGATSVQRAQPLPPKAEGQEGPSRFSCVVVVDAEQVVGILTESDVVRLLAQQQSLQSLQVKDVMAQPALTLKVAAFTDLFAAAHLLRQHNIRHLPIVNERQQLVGVLTHDSLQKLFSPMDLLRLKQVSDVMISEVVWADQNTSLLGLAQQMATHQVKTVVIVEQPAGGEGAGSLARPVPIGMVTKQDLFQCQALGVDFKTCLAKTAMSTPVFTAQPDDTLWNVHHIMASRFVRRVVVTGDRGELLGLVTQPGLLKVLSPLELFNTAEALEKKVSGLEAEKMTLLSTRNAELERRVQARTAELEAKAQREKILADLATKIRSSLSLQTILETTVRQVRQLLGCDRVNIWRFEGHWEAVAVAESTDYATSLNGERIDDTCFKQTQAEVYRQGKVRVVRDIYEVEMADCHRELLVRLHTRAKIILPLMCGDQLWGLLNVTESDRPRDWQPEEISLLKDLSVQLAIALHQATTHEQLQAELGKRQQAEARLRESEQRYVSLVEASPVGIFRTDAAGRCTYVNPRWCEIAGLTPAEAVGDGWLQGLHPDDRERMVAQWAQSSVHQRAFELEYRFCHPDGHVIWVHGQSGVAERDSQGRVVGYVGTVTDITSQKQAEAARKQATAKLEQLNQTLEAKVKQRTRALAITQSAVDLAAEGVFLVRPDSSFQYVNDAACKMLGYSQPELMALTTRAINPRFSTKAWTTHWKAIKQKKSLTFESCYRHKSGRTYPVEVSINYLALDGEEYSFAFVKDISHRKQAEAQLQQSNEELIRATRLKDEFLANMSHELRTPLNAILGMAEGLQDSIFGTLTPQQRKALQTIERSGSHLLELINDILDVAKIESGQIDLDLSPAAIHSLCQSSLTFIKQQALKKQIHLETKLPSFLPDISVDQRRIRQVLINLLNNAVKFTPEGGTITLEATLQQPSSQRPPCPGLALPQPFVDPYLRIDVIDTGIGIDEEDLGKLFQPFIQIDSALNRQYQGTGLGLALVKRIVELHGGQVTVNSQVGEGSCFSVYLPCPAVQVDVPEILPPIDSVPLKPTVEVDDAPLILIAEDNEANISTFSSYLSVKGYRLLLAKNGQAAIDLARTQQPDLILMDVQMPGIDGLESIRKIRQMPDLLQVPIIALTALAMEGDRDRCLAAGANEYLSKPIRLKSLNQSIQTWLAAAANSHFKGLPELV